MDLEIILSGNLESSKNILGICPTCKTESKFVYEGLQDGYGDIPNFLLYTCENCHSTISKESITIEK